MYNNSRTLHIAVKFSFNATCTCIHIASAIINGQGIYIINSGQTYRFFTPDSSSYVGLSSLAQLRLLLLHIHVYIYFQIPA